MDSVVRIVTALLCLALAACAQTGAVAPQATPSPPPPPRLEVVITPDVENGEVAAISVSLRVESPNVQAGGALLRLPLVFAATPTARYGADAIVADDEGGVLELVAEDDPVDPNNSIYFRRYRASRATQGDVRVRFTAPGSLFGPRATVGPPFNLMRQDGGFSGAGMSFIAVPDTKQVYRIAMRWNLEEMSASARGVWSMGEGSVDTVGPVEMVQYAYYMAGPALRSYPAEGAGNFGIY